MIQLEISANGRSLLNISGAGLRDAMGNAGTVMNAPAIYVLAAVCEIGGCFGFWAWLRLGRPVWWAVAGLMALAGFAYLLTRVDVDAAGRAFAAYGGVYIVASLVWLWLFESLQPTRFDLAGGALCLVGAAVIVLGPRLG